MNYFAEWDAEQSPSALDHLEKAYLGACVLVPGWLDFGASLRPVDFSTRSRGHIFDTMRSFPRRRFDSALLAVALEQAGPPPVASWGWCVGHLMDCAAAIEDLMPAYVRSIKEAAALRRASRSDA